jgi:hypothetical protein
MADVKEMCDGLCAALNKKADSYTDSSNRLVAFCKSP